MTATAPAALDFYFDFSSPYGYLMSERIDAVAARHGRKVKWHPVLLGVIFRELGGAPLTEQNPAKAAYSVLDFNRSARFMGIPYRHPPLFPLPTQYAARAYYWLHGQDCGLARQFGHAAFRALFVDNRDLSAPETIIDLATALGASGDHLATALKSPEMKARLKAECDSALQAGVFGSPHVVIDGQPFFGADRLPQIEKWLANGSF